MKNGDAAASGYETASYVIAGVGLLLVIKLHLLPALLAGFLVYELVHTLAPILRATRLGGVRAKIVAVAILASAIITLLGLGIWGMIIFLHSEGGSLPALMQKMAEILERSWDTFPSWLSDYLPSDPERVKAGITHWLRTHAGDLQLIGKETIHEFICPWEWNQGHK